MNKRVQPRARRKVLVDHLNNSTGKEQILSCQHTGCMLSAGQKSDQPLLLTYNVAGKRISLLHPHPIPTLILYLCLLFGSRALYQKWVWGDRNYQLAVVALKVRKPCDAGKASATGINVMAVPVPSWVCWEAGTSGACCRCGKCMVTSDQNLRVYIVAGRREEFRGHCTCESGCNSKCGDKD